MFGISIEHLLIVGVVLLLFGPRRLPELGKSLGQSIRNFKDGFNGIDRDQKSGQTLASLEKKEGESQDSTHDPKGGKS